MAAIRKRRGHWTDPVAADADAILVYSVAVSDEADAQQWLGVIDAQNRTPDPYPVLATVPIGVQEFYFDEGVLPEGTYHIALATADQTGNISDPVLLAADLPLDVTPPDSPTPGGID